MISAVMFDMGGTLEDIFVDMGLTSFRFKVSGIIYPVSDLFPELP